MSLEERAAVEKLMKIAANIADITYVNLLKQEFLSSFTVDITKCPKYLIQLLKCAYNQKNEGDVEYILFVGSVFNIFSENFLDILCDLIVVSWHFQHENIALILQELKSPISVTYLYQAALLDLQYLSYSDIAPLATKCIWALGYIKTQEAKDKLEILAKSSCEVVKNEAKYQLKNWSALPGEYYLTDIS